MDCAHFLLSVGNNWTEMFFLKKSFKKCWRTSIEILQSVVILKARLAFTLTHKRMHVMHYGMFSKSLYCLGQVTLTLWLLFEMHKWMHIGIWHIDLSIHKYVRLKIYLDLERCYTSDVKAVNVYTYIKDMTLYWGCEAWILNLPIDKQGLPFSYFFH